MRDGTAAVRRPWLATLRVTLCSAVRDGHSPHPSLGRRRGRGSGLRSDSRRFHLGDDDHVSGASRGAAGCARPDAGQPAFSGVGRWSGGHGRRRRLGVGGTLRVRLRCVGVAAWRLLALSGGALRRRRRCVCGTRRRLVPSCRGREGDHADGASWAAELGRRCSRGCGAEGFAATRRPCYRARRRRQWRFLRGGARLGVVCRGSCLPARPPQARQRSAQSSRHFDSEPL